MSEAKKRKNFEAKAKKRNAKARAPRQGCQFGVHETVFCYHGPLLYEAKIKSVGFEAGRPLYDVHYKGWNVSWDEWVEEERMVKFTWEANLRAIEAKAQLKREMQMQAAVEAAQAKAEAEAEAAAAAAIGGAGSGTQAAGEDVIPAAAARGVGTTASSGTKKRKRASGASKVASKAKKAKTGKSGAAGGGMSAAERFALPLPELLIQFLMSDAEFITKEYKIVPVPRAPSVSSVLKTFLTAVEAEDGDPRIEIVDGLRSLFNVTLPMQLLYRFERVQYIDTVRSGGKADAAPVEPADVYGAEHLLRLLIRVPDLLRAGSYTASKLDMLMACLRDLVAFLEANPHFFLDEYETPSPAYLRTAAE